METLDLRGVKCPTNFVKTRLKLDKMAAGEQLTVLLGCWRAGGERLQ
jgi:TusA-related sulfurtransferase